MLTQLTEFASNHTLLVIAFVALLIVILLNEAKNLGQKFTKLSPAAAVNLMNNDDVIFLDVREPSETTNGKIIKAIQMPIGTVKDRMAELEKHKDKPIVVYCKTGTRSSIACNALTSQGFSNVHNLTGGIMSWQEAHLPIVKK